MQNTTETLLGLVHTKSNYRNMNGRWVKITKLRGPELDCTFYTEEFDRVTCSLNLTEIKSMKWAPAGSLETRLYLDKTNVDNGTIYDYRTRYNVVYRVTKCYIKEAKAMRPGYAILSLPGSNSNQNQITTHSTHLKYEGLLEELMNLEAHAGLTLYQETEA
jgi:hypothetical protein